MNASESITAARPDAVADRPAPTARLVLLLAWPVLAQQLLNFIVLLSDQFLAGYFEGEVTAQAAQTTAHYLGWFISSCTVLVSAASTALVGRFVGAQDSQKAIHVTNQSVLLGFVFGVAGVAVGLLVVGPLVNLLGLRGEAEAHAVSYLRPLIVMLLFQMVEQAGIYSLFGAGDMRTGMWVLGGVAVVNVPLGWYFYHVFGFPGIALGTTVSHALGCAAVLTVLAHGRAGLRLEFSQLWPDMELIRRLLWIGVPAGFDSLSVAAGHLWFLSIVNHLGDVASSAHGIALRWEGLAYLSGHAFGVAAMSLIGQNLGAGRPDRAAHSGWTAFGLGLGVMCAMAVVFYVFAPEMFLAFCPRPEQAGVIVEGVPVLRLVAFAVPAMASCIIFTGALRGAGDTRVPVLFTWVGFLLVRIPLAYALTLNEIDLGPLGTWPGAGMGLFGAWLAMFADLVVRGGFFLYRFASGRWQLIHV
jgi:putative MATE family efflux protein